MKKIILFLAGILFAANAYAFTLFGESKVTQYWSKSNEANSESVSHADWNGFLNRYIRAQQGINFLSYGNVSNEDEQILSTYISYLEGLKVTDLQKREQFAYWINLYNALTVKVILAHYPTESILDISYGLLSRGPWKEPLIEVEQQALSLDDIEHQILRPIFKDQRIHYAVNCASISCPNLQPTAFTKNNLENLLELGAEQYINHPRGVNVEQGKLIASSIFDWYGSDFGSEDNEVIAHFIKYANPELAKQLQKLDEIADFQYDWSLNE